MRQAVVALLELLASSLHAQRLDLDQNPYWARYTLVEDSDTLVPLTGDYHVYYIQSGMWWSMIQPEYPIRDLPEESMRYALLPLSILGHADGVRHHLQPLPAGSEEGPGDHRLPWR